jgi:hypothetical protein
MPFEPRHLRGARRSVGKRRYFSRVAADKSDEPGVLGNLPRSRPGRRSDKRGEGARGSAASGAASNVAKAAKADAQKADGGAKPAGARRKPAARKAPAKRVSAAAGTPAGAARTSGQKRAADAKAPTPRAAKSAAARSESEGPPPRHDEGRGGTDPLTGAVQLAGKVAEAGLKTATGILKRISGR